MELQYYGANCVKISTKKASLIIDDTLASLGLKSVTKNDDIALFTGTHEPKATVKISIDQPGEYEVSNISIQGIQARAHMDEASVKSATMFKLVVDDIRIAIVGHVYPELNNDQLEQLGTVDVLVIPVGGNGYTLDPVGALKLIKEIEPKIIVPTHYDDKAIKYEVPQQPLEEAVKVFAMEVAEPVAKLKIKSGEMSDIVKLVILERQ